MLNSQKNIPTKSFARLIRQLFFMPVLHRKWLNQAFKQELATQITQAELNTSGEIFVVIENNLPLSTAYKQTPRMRATELFAIEHVWDTEENTGILVYINVCEHDLEIVADRGIAKSVPQKTWNDLCEQAIQGIKQGHQLQSISLLIQEIGQLLQEFHGVDNDVAGNELSDTVKHIK